MRHKINVKTTNNSLTPSISEYIEKKLNTLEKFFGDEEVLAMVEIGRTTRHHRSGDIFRAEMHIIAPKLEHYAVSEKDDLYAAIDEVKDEVTYSLSSKKKKALRLIRRGGAQIKNLIKVVRDIGNRGWKRFRRR